MTRIPATLAAVEVMVDEGADTVFCCPDDLFLPLYQEIERDGRIERVVADDSVRMAVEWSRANDAVGVAVGADVITASDPVVCVSGQVDSTDIVKWAVRVGAAAQIPWVFREAFRVAREGRPGPVLIGLPRHVQERRISYDASIDTPLPIRVVEPHLPRVDAALDLLLAAERPLIVADASRELRELAEYLRIPVVDKDSLHGDPDFPTSDLVLAVDAQDSCRHGRRFIQVEAEPIRLGQVAEPELGIVSDARSFLSALLQLAKVRAWS